MIFDMAARAWRRHVSMPKAHWWPRRRAALMFAHYFWPKADHAPGAHDVALRGLSCCRGMKPSEVHVWAGGTADLSAINAGHGVKIIRQSQAIKISKKTAQMPQRQNEAR